MQQTLYCYFEWICQSYSAFFGILSFPNKTKYNFLGPKWIQLDDKFCTCLVTMATRLVSDSVGDWYFPSPCTYVPCCIQPCALLLTSFTKQSFTNFSQFFDNLKLSKHPSCLNLISVWESNGRTSKLIWWCNIFTNIRTTTEARVVSRSLSSLWLPNTSRITMYSANERTERAWRPNSTR